jgi:ATP adenylyltransferase
MNKLWSPWRSQYIDSFNNKSEEDGCVFCEMTNKDPDDLSNLIVDKGALTFTVLNLYPYNNGHLMIVPYRHTSEFISLTDSENNEIMNKMRIAYNALQDILHPEGFNMGLNLGRVAGAGIHEHIHFHIVPRWNGDTNFMPVLGEVKVISQDLIETKKKLLQVYRSIKNQ